MSHVRLVGLKRDQNRILDELIENGLFEARVTDALKEPVLASGDTGLYRELKLKQAKISFALDFLKSRHAYMQSVLADNRRAVKKGLERPIEFTLSDKKYSGARMLITRADFSDAAAKEFDLLHVCDELEKISFETVDAKSRISELKSEIDSYLPYLSVGLRFSEFRERGGITLALFSCTGAFDRKEQLNELPCAYEISRGSFGTNVVAVYRTVYEDEISKAFAGLGCTRCTFDDDCTAKQKISALADEKADAEKCIIELTQKALGFEKYVDELCILYDVIELDIERADAASKFLKTDSTFILEGWLPERVAEDTVAKVEQKCENVFIQLLAADEKDEPPTLVVNNAVVKPYEQITDMYSSPRYGEIDPNPIMAIFYFLFFGIMIGDAAYGVILAVAGFIVGKSKKFDTGLKKLALLIAMGGVSAVIWGVLFGGYFSIDFGFEVAILLNPIEQPLLLLALSIVLGIVQLAVGYIIKFVALCKEGKPFSAIFDCGSMILLFAALGFMIISMLPSLAPMLGIEVGFEPPAWITTVAVALALTGVALILVFGGRNSKNVFGKIVGGFKGLYGLINVVSDILSYCRLFGLCLASCAIGLAFNELGGILFGIPYVGYVVGVVVLIPLHAFNLALGVLSAYVHDARLQFLEFYGRFYDGGGRLFSPLGVRTKYVRFA